MGKTTALLIWISERAFAAKRGNNFWWVAPVYSQSAIAFTRLKQGLPRQLYVANEADLKVTLINGAVIWFKSADKPDNLYGEDVYACVIDEATRVDDKAWHAIRTTLTATRGPVKIIGNVKDRRNWVYEMGQLAQTKTNSNLSYHRITAWDAVEAGILQGDEVEDAKKNLPAHIFRRDYEAIPTDEAGNPFGLNHIRACIRPRLSDGDPEVWGWDLARAEDWTVGIALDRHNNVCRFERWQAPWMATVRNIVAITRKARALVDSTGVGDPILEMLLQQGGSNYEGFHFTGPSKQNLLERLSVAIQQGEIGYPDDNLPLYPLVAELEDFEYKSVPTGVRYSAPEGHHDDCVIALALANWHRDSGSPVLVLDRLDYHDRSASDFDWGDGAFLP